MPHSKTSLFMSTELLDLYSVPVLNDIERQQYFTFNTIETEALHRLVDVKSAVYFAITLVFYKLKHTFIAFQYQAVTAERQHVMQRYFPDLDLPKSMPTVSTKKRIHLIIMEICQAQRLTGPLLKTVEEELSNFAPYAPRQRQLLKKLLQILDKHRIIIPGQTTLQTLVSRVWNQEQKRILQMYMRQTTSKQRKAILTLLDKPEEEISTILMMKTDLKSFKTHDLWQEIEKYKSLKLLFEVAKSILQKLNLPLTTYEYYAGLIRSYDRLHMKRLNSQKIGFYLLCYIFIRYQTVHDILGDAFKKRIADLETKSEEYIEKEQLTYLKKNKETHAQISAMMLGVEQSSFPFIRRKNLYKYIPKEDWHDAALSLVDENFNEKCLFWKYIDNFDNSIKLSIRALFLVLDFTIKPNDPLGKIVTYLKQQLEAKTFSKAPFPTAVTKWLEAQPENLHITKNDKIIQNRFEFLVYMKMAHALRSNKMTLQDTVRYKNIDEEIIDPKTWSTTKESILKKLDYPKLSCPLKDTLKEKKEVLTSLYKTVNAGIEKGENKSVIIKKNKKGERTWRLRPIEAEPKPNETLFANLPQHNIVEVIKFVNQQTNFIKAFEPLLPKGTQTSPEIEYIAAVTHANALRMGVNNMASNSDLNKSKLTTTETNYFSLENLCAATDMINNATAKFSIFEKWYLNSIYHGTLDALKLGMMFPHYKGRNSSKYFGCGLGVSALNEIVNGLSVTGRIIGAHEYEGGFHFEMCLLQNTSEIKPTHISTDKHGMNVFNFALFDLVDMIFAPRIPKPHTVVLWGFGKAKDYEGFLIKPTRFVNERLLVDEDDNIKRIMVSFLTGHVSPSIVLQKLSAKEYTSKTKRALVQYNNVVMSTFILQTIHDPDFLYLITKMLNRGESYNGLYRAISILNDGELRGKSELEMEIWNQCTRLIAAIIHYYNTYIIDTIYQRSQDDDEKKFLENLSPTAWVHIILLGFFQFFSEQPESWVEDCLRQWDWQENSRKMTEKKTSKNQQRKKKKDEENKDDKE